MKRSRQTLWLSLLLATIFLTGCAGQPARTLPPFQPTNLTDAGYDRRVDHFVILFDASSSMDERRNGLVKFKTAREFVKRLNTILPELGYEDAFISYGHDKSISRKHTLKHHGLSPYRTTELAATIDGLTEAGGTTPMAKAIHANRGLLDGATGHIAVLMISDGLDLGEAVLEAARQARAKFGERMCVYPILVGDDPAGRQLMQALAETAGCGFFTQAEDTLTGEAMAKFATRVFLTEKAGPKDSDGDGVYDHLDRCPGTPFGTPVDARGCPLPPKPAAPVDSDGDGVYDDDDYCPDTPRGATVDDRGCWVLQGVEFESNKAEIRPLYEPELEGVANVLENNPGLRIQIQGHTDSVGAAEYNRQLSERRARAVMEWLINRGIDRKRLSAIGLGESRPIANNDSDVGRKRNRRVELKPMP